MRIKEAAQYCGLTEKAIRLYEAKGLIRPKTEERNGRTFREYDGATIRELLTVGTLRRADFTMEQIRLMQQSPEKIPEVFAAYREEVKENATRLSALSRVMDTMAPAGEVTLEDFADRLALAMMPEKIAAISGETAEAPTEPPVIHFHHYVWDEEGTPEEKEIAYRRFLEKQARREKIEEVVFAVPRRIGAFFGRIGAGVSRRIRGEDNRVKGTVKLTAVFLLICGLLLNGLINNGRRFEKLQVVYTHELFNAMHDTVYTLRRAVASGEYTYVHSEKAIQNLTVIDKSAAMAAYLYHGEFAKGFYDPVSLTALTNALGNSYAANHNGAAVESILYDGVTTEKELRFIEALLADLEAVYGAMLDEDGLNLRKNLRYKDIRGQLNRFLQKWEHWEEESAAPYALLNRE